jgi:hypothetical protein
MDERTGGGASKGLIFLGHSIGLASRDSHSIRFDIVLRVKRIAKIQGNGKSSGEYWSDLSLLDGQMGNRNTAE